MNKLLCIVGPTATGKTALAVELSRKYPSVLISADSRQVYKGMDVVTGKDHPQDLDLLGIDLVGPSEDCSVSKWHTAVYPHLEAAWGNNKLPIVVGGTGLYVKSLVEPIGTIGIPRNEKLRGEISSFGVKDLQKLLQKLSPTKLNDMNNSDRNNPRRLLRAIEVAYGINQTPVANTSIPNSLIIGLFYPASSKYSDIVRARVKSRLENGAIQETQALLKKYAPTIPSMSAIGYKHIIKFLNSEIDQTQLIEDWTREEINYAKRQITWFNKVKNVAWFEATDPHKLVRVAELVNSWYHQD